MNLALVADIGGTHARFALTDTAEPGVVLKAQQTLRAADFPSLQDAAAHYLHLVGAQPRRAAFAVASPVSGDEIQLTNRAWSFTRGSLARALRLESLTLLNDFGAVAWAVPALEPAHLSLLHGDPGAPLVTPATVLGPGTGLGVALLLDDPQQHWRVLETEGGHASFAPLGEEEELLNRWLTDRFGRVSNERLLCGDGLSQIEAALRSAADPAAADPRGALREPARIVDEALAGHDATARRALARFCAVLGSVAGDCALLHGARSVVIAGGIVPRFVPFLRDSAFRQRFLAKGRFAGYLEGVSIRVITHPQPGLLGAAVALHRLPSA